MDCDVDIVYRIVFLDHPSGEIGITSDEGLHHPFELLPHHPALRHQPALGRLELVLEGCSDHFFRAYRPPSSERLMNEPCGARMNIAGNDLLMVSFRQTKRHVPE